jgi:hypothetical protein
VYETRKQPVQVQYYEREEVKRTVMRPVTRQVYVPYTETQMVPRQVVERVPLSYYDPFSPAIVSGYSSFSTPTESSSTLNSTIVTQPQGGGDTERTRVEKVEIDPPEPQPDPKTNDGDAEDVDTDDDTTGSTADPTVEELLPPSQGVDA